MFDRIPLVLVLAQEHAPPPAPALPQTPVESPAGAPANGVFTQQPGGTDQALPPPPGGNMFTQLLPFILIIGIFWFILMGGQRRERKKRAAMMAAIKKGDRIQTVGGMLGTIVELRDDSVLVKVDDNVRIRFARAAIQSVVEEPTEEKK